MKKKLNSLKEYYKTHPKRFWALGIIIILVGFFYFNQKPATTVTEIVVKHQDLKQTVLATGQITSQTDLNLSFSASGIVYTLPVSVGDKVTKGQVLATLENRSEYASLKSAQANYQKVIEGASNEEIAVAQASLDSAKSDLSNTQKVQDTLVENAHRAYLNDDLTPISSSSAISTAPTITGTYSSDEEGSYVITTYATGNGGYFSYSGLETGNGIVSTSYPTALGTRGLYIQFPASYSSSTGSTWTVSLPNIKSANYLTQNNAYQNALKNRDSVVSAKQSVVTGAQANLDLKKASARGADIGVVQASVDSAGAIYDKTILRAPADGTIVHVDTKIGERADAQKEIMVLQDIGNLYVEANINETSIAKVALDQPVSMTLDAFGPETFFTGKVIHIDPSSTTTDGVVNYLIKASIETKCGALDVCVSAKDIVRPGMNANLTITAWDHPGVIAIPKASVEANADGSGTVEVLLDDKNDKREKRVVTLGPIGDGNMVEILSGLKDGEKIALITKQ
jgi:multidrug efflux pump subunit AcrA (membrane-fusion protein)